jgi:hypothetical protein
VVGSGGVNGAGVVPPNLKRPLIFLHRNPKISRKIACSRTHSLGHHEGLVPLLAHGGDRLIPVAALVEEREGAALGRARLERSVETTTFAGRAEQDEQGVGDGGEEEQSIATPRLAVAPGPSCP